MPGFCWRVFKLGGKLAYCSARAFGECPEYPTGARGGGLAGRQSHGRDELRATPGTSFALHQGRASRYTRGCLPGGEGAGEGDGGAELAGGLLQTDFPGGCGLREGDPQPVGQDIGEKVFPEGFAEVESLN